MDRVRITAENCNAILEQYHGFHDAQYGRFTFDPDPRGSGVFDCAVILHAYDHSQNRPSDVELCLFRIKEFQIKYTVQFDYPNVRDEVAIGFYDQKAYVNFGFATDMPSCPADVKAADIFFVCEEVYVRPIDISDLPSDQNDSDHEGNNPDKLA
jgi:hypothetical protein